MNIDEQSLEDNDKEAKKTRFRESIGLSIAISIMSIICALCLSIKCTKDTGDIIAVFGGAIFISIVVFLFMIRDYCKFVVMIDEQINKSDSIKNPNNKRS